MATTLDDLHLSESNAGRMALVKDGRGDEYICDLNAIHDIDVLGDEEKQECVPNVA